MPWAPPSWCAAPRSGAPGAVVTQTSHRGKPQRHDLSGSPFYLLERGQHEEEQTSRWHAAVLRNEQGECFVMDLSSNTGTFMNGQRLQPNKAYRWNPGATVVLGRPPRHDKATLQLSRGVKRAREGEAAEEAGSSSDAGSRAPKRRPRATEAASALGSTASEGGSSASSGSCEPPQAPVQAELQAGASSSGKCDRCDGPHRTEACPHFKRPRDVHKDAWVNYGRKSPKKMGRNGGKFFLKSGRAVPQPGDGSCLFHSLCFGLNGGRQADRLSAGKLRKELANFVQRNRGLRISGDTLEEWVRWDTNSTVDAYTRRIASGGWGGGIEMAACCHLCGVNVHVYERRRGGTFERISCFDSPKPTTRTIHVLYQGGVHYDALVPR